MEDVTIEEMIDRLNDFSIDDSVEESLEKSTEKMKRLQQDQLLRGERADGGKIGQYKNDAYAVKKYIQNPLAGFGNMDWILTGALKKEVFVLIGKDDIEIDSLNEKTDSLIKNNGDPFGLTDENEQKLIDEGLEDDFDKNIQEKLSL